MRRGWTWRERAFRASLIYLILLGSTWGQGCLHDDEEVPEDTRACFTAEPDSGLVPLEVQFRNCSNGIQFLWDFGDGFSSTQEEPMHTYEDPGQHQVSLTAIGPEESDVAGAIIAAQEPTKCLVTPVRIDFPEICSGESLIEDISISNIGNVTFHSEVRWKEGTQNLCGKVSSLWFDIIEGGGTYKLTPGAQRLVRVRFLVSGAIGSVECELELGVDCHSVIVTGQGRLCGE